MIRIDSDLARAYLWWRQTNPWHRAASCFVKAHLDVVKGKRRYPNSADHVYHGTWQPDGRGYFCDDVPAGWRDCGTAHDVSKAEHSRAVEHDGWYVDDSCGEAIYGIVVQLPARHGVCQYVPGWRSNDADGITLYPLDRFDTALDAARYADRRAELTAENERDYLEAWRAGQDVANKTDDIDRLRAKCLTKVRMTIAALEGEHNPVVLDWLREERRDAVRDTWEQICELRDDIERLRSEVPTRLMDAFNDGFGT